jgi:hypothetical protein
MFPGMHFPRCGTTAPSTAASLLPRLPFPDFARMGSRAAIFAAGILLAAVSPVQAKELYRYVDEEGVSVIASSIPPKYVPGGYEILNEDGRVLEVVPRQLTEQERRELNAEQRAALLADQEQERLRQYDESLMLRYSTVEDIESARDRELRDLKIRITIQRGEVRSLKSQVEDLQAQAADQERMGQQPEQKLLKAIDDLQDRIATTETSIVDREREVKDVEAAYQKDIDRFQNLLDIVEMRRERQQSEP